MSTAIGRKAATNVRGYLVAVALSVVALGALAAGAHAAPAPQPAWKLLAATGPTNLPPRQSEIQRVTVEAEAGQFTLAMATEGEGTLSFGEGLALSYASGAGQISLFLVTPGTAFQVGQELIAGPGIAPGTTVTGVSADGSTINLSQPTTAEGSFAVVTAGSKEVTGVSPTGAFQPGHPIAGAGIPVGTTIVSVGGGTLALSEFPTVGGTVDLTSSEVTTPITFDANAAEVQSALEALPALAGGAVRVGGGPGGDIEHPWTVDFAGQNAEGRYALKDVPELVADGTMLLGEHATARVATAVPGGNGTGEIAVYPSNVGARATSGTVTVTVGPLPSGIVTSGPATSSGVPATWACPGGGGEDTITCTTTKSLPPAQIADAIDVPVEVEPSVATTGSAPVTVSGGEGGEATVQMPIPVSAKPAAPGIQAFWAGAFEADGAPSTQAGAHPASAITDFELNTVRATTGQIVPAGDPKDIGVDLPPGFTGDPLVTERCPQDNLVPPTAGEGAACGLQDQIGNFSPLASGEFAGGPQTARIFNDIPANGAAAEFSSRIVFPIQSLIGSVRSSEDLGVTVMAPQIPTFKKIYGSFVSLEGVPVAAHGLAFLRNPTDCAVQREETAQGRGPATRIKANTWQQPTEFGHAEDPLPLLTGCARLTDAWLGHGPDPAQEEPTFSFQPTNAQGSSPTGATAILHIPQVGLTDPDRLATSDLKKTVVTLPQGLNVNPSSAAGLEACTETQVGFEKGGQPSPNPLRFDEEPVTCPNGSKLGSFTISTPLLEEPVEGTIYLAAQEENPFHSLIALYLVVENRRFGITLKLPGEVVPDPATGQLTATFDNNPQLPFENLTLRFRGGGGRSTLATPEVCGHFETTGSLEPWSAENGEALPVHEAGFTTDTGCASSESARPFAPAFEAGTTSPTAGAYSPLVVKLSRRDGEQELKSLDFTLPKGLTGKLAGIPYCPEDAIKAAEAKSGKAEQSSPSCPAASKIGSVDTSAGVGSEPIHVGGSVYLAGPYEGAPLSSVVVTPAVAGPFDLGDVVVRAPLFINPETAQITAKSDPIPTILKGIPLKVRSVSISVDRSSFSLNPTSCDPMSVTGLIGGSSGATASPSDRFQVGGCTNLKFKPKLKISLKGATKHTGHPALKAVVTYPKEGAYANIARAQVNLPHSEFLDQGNLNKTCTKPVLLAGNCPAKSIYGKAKAWTPLLERPLEGPVYLVGGYGYKLPALVADLNGQIRVTLVGKVDSGPNKGIRNTFEAVPDAPVSRFVLEMKGGKKYGLLENSESLCAKPQKAITRFTAQNGKVLQAKPVIANNCKKHKGKGKGKRQKAKAKK